MCQLSDSKCKLYCKYKLNCQNFDFTVKYKRNDLIKQDSLMVCLYTGEAPPRPYFCTIALLYNYHRVIGHEIIGIIPVCTPVIFPAITINKVPEPVFPLTQQSKG